MPAGAPLYLVFAEAINERNEITGQACVLVDGACPATGAVTPAFLAVPSFESGQAGDALEAGAASGAAPAVAVPREQYLQPLRRFGVRTNGSR